MNCQRLREQLADFVAGELDAQQRAAAQQHIDACEQCRELVRGLQAAAATLESGLISANEAERQTASMAAPRARAASDVPIRGVPGVLSSFERTLVWRRRLSTIVRYAAIVLLAFVGGYFARGWRLHQRAARQEPARLGLEAAPQVSRELASRYAEAAQQFPDSSTFSRSLLMLARP
jgi:anti-sigma factor RsiW